MACFLVPATEAIVSTIVTKKIDSKESAADTLKVNASEENLSVHIPLSRTMKWLNNMLWGGSALLAFEHVWHGELTAWFPFLTAASNPVNFTEMLHEMSTVGVAMSVLVTAVWGAMVLVTNTLEKRVDKERIPMK